MKKNPLLFSTVERFVLPMLDITLFLMSYIAASIIRYGKIDITKLLSFNLVCIVGIILTTFYIFDNYRIQTNIQGLRTPGRTIFATLIAAIGIIIFIYAKGQERYIGEWFGRGILPIGLSIFALYASTTRLLVHHWFRGYHDNFKWLVLGDIHDSTAFHKDFVRTFDQSNFTLLVKDKTCESSAPKLPIAGTWDEIDKWIEKPWAGIIVNNPTMIPDALLSTLMKKRLAGMKVYDLIEFYENIWFKIPIFCLRDAWFATSSGFLLLHNAVGLKFKRIIDLILSIIFLITMSPIFLITSIIIKLMGGPIIYKQTRTGEAGKEFIIYKFRTMNIDAEKDGHKWAAKNDPRITFIGKLLRLTRIDEWPQCSHVLKGDMSFIGPRPERPEFNETLERELPYYKLRYLVKPGITGWAQILYPYGASLEDSMEKLQYDLYYIKNYSILMDFTIILKTIRVVLLGQGR